MQHWRGMSALLNSPVPAQAEANRQLRVDDGRRLGAYQKVATDELAVPLEVDSVRRGIE